MNVPRGCVFVVPVVVVRWKPVRVRWVIRVWWIPIAARIHVFSPCWRRRGISWKAARTISIIKVAAIVAAVGACIVTGIGASIVATFRASIVATFGASIVAAFEAPIVAAFGKSIPLIRPVVSSSVVLRVRH